MTSFISDASLGSIHLHRKSKFAKDFQKGRESMRRLSRCCCIKVTSWGVLWRHSKTSGLSLGCFSQPVRIYLAFCFHFALNNTIDLIPAHVCSPVVALSLICAFGSSKHFERSSCQRCCRVLPGWVLNLWTDTFKRLIYHRNHSGRRSVSDECGDERQNVDFAQVLAKTESRHDDPAASHLHER